MGRGGDTLKPGPTSYEQFLPLPTPCFKMFLERSLNDPPPPHFKHLSLLTFSYPKYPQLSRAPPLVQSTSSCREHLQLSRAPLVVQSISSCREHLQLSKVLQVVESTSSCREHLQLSRAPPVVQSISSYR